MINNFLNFIFVCLLSASLFAETPYVLVSVAPHKFFVEKIADETVNVGLIVPAGASAHTYEPSPRQMMTASQADMWFRIGEPFENKVIHTLKSYRPQIEIVDLRKDIPLLGPEQGGCCCHAHCADLHFWLSARLAQTQATTIAEALIKQYPQHAEKYRSNLSTFKHELQQLDQSIENLLKPLKQRTILVSHPAYAYFCKDYNLQQLSIEFEGRDPSPQQLTKLLEQVRKLNIKTIYIQEQYSNKGAKLVANEIGARVLMLDPYSEHYMKSMLEIAHAFAEN